MKTDYGLMVRLQMCHSLFVYSTCVVHMVDSFPSLSPSTLAFNYLRVLNSDNSMVPSVLWTARNWTDV